MEHLHHNSDRLSELPDSLITVILSLLSMKDAVKTGILSKKWNKLWTHVYNIVFDFPCVEKDELGQEMEIRVDFNHILMQCTANNVNKFCLRSSFDFSNSIGEIVTFALAKNVKFLQLSLRSCVPDCLFQSLSLTKLSLCKMEFKDHVLFPVNLISLKSLFLGEMLLHDMLFGNILVGCPVLETLVLRDVTGINHINIMSLTVKNLELYDIKYDSWDDSPMLEIRAPWIRELVISERFLVSECRLVDVSSLVKATVTFTTHVFPLKVVNHCVELRYYGEVWIPMVNKLLKSLNRVDELIIGSDLIQVLSLSKLTSKPTPFFKCKQLSIETRFWKFDFLGIACLLENSPALETLFIKVLGDWEETCPLYQIIRFFTKSDGPNLGIPNRNLVHLKNVEIDYWRYPCGDNAEQTCGQFYDFELVEFILRGAVNLDKLVLCSSNSSWHCCKPGLLNCSSFQYVTRLSSKLLTTLLVGNEAADWGELSKSKNKFEYTFSNYKSLFPKDRA